MSGALPLLLAGGLLATAVVLFILHPLVKGIEAPLEVEEDDPDAADLEHRRRVALGALRDAEYDFATGKLDEEDYRRLRGDLAREALALLDDGSTEEPSPEGDEGPDAAPDEIDALEAEIARIRSGLREGTTCRTCAHVNPAGSRFCGRCGTPLARPERAGVGAGEVEEG